MGEIGGGVALFVLVGGSGEIPHHSASVFTSTIVAMSASDGRSAIFRRCGCRLLRTAASEFQAWPEEVVEGNVIAVLAQVK